ncbi:MAG: family 78 glycoside hydrolase catalytic domain [Planctomycetota bacterium]
MGADEIGLDGFMKGRRWAAKTIHHESLFQENGFALFRREFVAPTRADGMRLFIAAKTHYRLYLNGELLARGPVISQVHLPYYDEIVLEGLEPGKAACLAVEVNQPKVGADAQGSLRGEVVDGEDRVLTATDESWRVVKASAWSQGSYSNRMNMIFPYQEVFDARRVALGYMAPGYDDNGWDTAQVQGGQNECRFRPRDIPMMELSRIRPIAVESTEECLDLAPRTRNGDISISLSAVGCPLEKSRLEGVDSLLSEDGVCVAQASTLHLDKVYDGRHDPCVVLDMGRVVTAYVELDVEGAAGTAVEVGCAERLVDGRFNNAIECCFGDRYTLREGRQIFTTFAWRSFRYLKLRFKECDTPVTVHGLTVLQTRYPFENRGAFSSSDELLNGSFEISRATLRLCSHDGMFDTPFREQAQWLGDVAAVTVPGVYACFGDVALPGKFLRQSGMNQSVTGMISNISNCEAKHGELWNIPDYSLWWVICLWEHYLYTGEERWLHLLYPQATRIIQDHLTYINEDGFIEDMPYWNFIDWAHVDKRGECAPYNAIFVGALEAYRGMAVFKGDSHMVGIAEQVVDGIRSGFQDRFFDSARGLFADCRVDGQLSERTSEHANLAAIRWDLCDGETQDRVIARLYEEGDADVVECQPFFMVVVLKALARAGRMELALRLIRERWGERMVARGLSSCTEEWGMNGSWRDGVYKGFERTLSHAWSACPAEFLIRDLIGLEIQTPGFSKVNLAPYTGLDYQVIYPTPKGDIQVSCQNGEVTVKLPEGIERA